MNQLSQFSVVHFRKGIDVGVLVENGAVFTKIIFHHGCVVQQLITIVLQHDIVRMFAESGVDVLLLHHCDQIRSLDVDPDILYAIDCSIRVDAFNMDIKGLGSDFLGGWLLFAGRRSLHMTIDRCFGLHEKIKNLISAKNPFPELSVFLELFFDFPFLCFESGCVACSYA